MRGSTQQFRTVLVAAIAALSLSGAAGLPSGPGSFGGSGGVATAQAVTYVRVSSLGRPTRATAISIQRLGISMPIREGSFTGTISTRYAYHYPSTSWPGGRSNTYIYAHAQAGAFLKLRYARIGDIVTFRLYTGRYVKYRVNGVRSVAWNDLRWLRATSTERITLQTCLGNTKYSKRLIVTAVPAY